MQLEWHEVVASAGERRDAPGFDPSGLIKKLLSHLAELTAARTAEAVSWIALLFGPLGLIAEIAIVVLAQNAGRNVANREPTRVMRAKKRAKVGVNGMRSNLGSSLSADFRKVNAAMASKVLAQVSSRAGEQERTRHELLERMERWRRAFDEVQRAMARGDELIAGVEP